jgi:hypothetical protein
MQAQGDLLLVSQRQPPGPGHPPVVADRPTRGIAHDQRDALV